MSTLNSRDPCSQWVFKLSTVTVSRAKANCFFIVFPSQFYTVFYCFNMQERIFTMEHIFQELTSAIWHLIRYLSAAFSPLIIGLVLAYLLYPAVRWLQGRFSTGTAIAITYFSFFLSLAALTGGFVVLIVGTIPTGGISETLHQVSRYFEEAYASASGFLSRWFPAGLSSSHLSLQNLQDWAANQLTLHSLTGMLSTVSSSLLSFFLGIIASIYLLKDRDYFLLLTGRVSSLLFPQRMHGVLCEFLWEVNSVISAFLKGALLDSLIVAFLSSAILSVLNIPFSVVIGITAGILNIIPYFGPFTAMALAFLAVLFAGGPAKSIAAVLSLFLVQQLDSNYLYPRIVGNTTGLHPLFILLAVSIFGYFFNLTGMLLAVPAAGILQIFLKHWAFR